MGLYHIIMQKGFGPNSKVPLGDPQKTQPSPPPQLTSSCQPVPRGTLSLGTQPGNQMGDLHSPSFLSHKFPTFIPSPVADQLQGPVLHLWLYSHRSCLLPVCVCQHYTVQSHQERSETQHPILMELQGRFLLLPHLEKGMFECYWKWEANMYICIFYFHIYSL